jgi:Gpi18-like mannosyltransferase
VILQRLGPPLAVFALARALLAAAALAAGLAPFDPRTFVRWDSAHYLAIAEIGYQLYPCQPEAGYRPGEWCGNTGWFPGYPWMIQLAHRTGLPTDAAGALLSALFHIATLVVLWNAFLGARWSKESALCIFLAGLFPGCIYQHAVFPVSTVVFCALLTLLLLRERRPLAAGLAGAAAALCYPTGLLLAPVAVLWAFIDPAAAPRGTRIRMLLVPAALTTLGFVAVLVNFQLAVHDWTAFFKAHHKYGHGWNWPIATLRRHVKPLVYGEWRWTSAVPALQVVLVALFILAVAFRVIRARRRGTAEPQDVLLLVFALSFWLFPLVLGAAMNPSRAEALLLPSAVLLRRLPGALQAIVVAAAAALVYPIALLFYYRILV